MIGPEIVPRPPRNAISTRDRSNSGSKPDCGRTWVRYRNHTPPTRPVIVADSTNAASLTRMVRTPKPARPVLVVPDRPELQAEPGPPDQDRDDHRGHGAGQRDVVEAVVEGRRRPGQERRRHPYGAAGKRVQVEGHQLEDEEHRDRDHDERMPAHPQRDQAERHRDHRSHRRGQRQQREHADAIDVPGLGRDAHGVGAAAEEHRLAERYVTGEAGEHVPGGDHGYEDQRVDRVVGDHRAAEHHREHDGHHGQEDQRQPGRRAPPAHGSIRPHCARTGCRPKNPVGRITSTTTRAA